MLWLKVLDSRLIDQTTGCLKGFDDMVPLSIDIGSHVMGDLSGGVT
jgi:hypothetical protein